MLTKLREAEYYRIGICKKATVDYYNLHKLSLKETGLHLSSWQDNVRSCKLFAKYDRVICHELILYSIKKNNIAIVKLAFNLYDKPVHVSNEHIFKAVYRGNYKILTYLYANIKSLDDKKIIAHHAIAQLVKDIPIMTQDDTAMIARAERKRTLNITNSHNRCFTFLLDFNIGMANSVYLCASECNNITFLKAVLKYKPDININSGQAFVNACRKGHIEMVKLLLDLGIRTDTSPNVLTLWSVQCNVKLFKLCIDFGVEVTPQVRTDVYDYKLTKLYSLVDPPSENNCCIS
jgi:ankyrin repeat protein